VQDALPFLQQAESVMIVEVSEGQDGNRALRNARDVAHYLSRHQVEIVTERVRPTDVTAANSLLRLIEDENINLIVAGAYGHSRLGEWAFGGVTRDLMTECRICCLFSN
jgi:nucleotide-binding universal stress UspA family protein